MAIDTDLLDDADEALLRHWRTSLSLIDPRYHDKALLGLAYRAMTDPAFRARLLSDEAFATETARRGELEGVTVRVVENTPTTLTLLLPPPMGEAATRPAALRDLLTSRTAADAAAGISSGDDWDFGDFGDSGPAPGQPNSGDPDSVDGPIFVTR